MKVKKTAAFFLAAFMVAARYGRWVPLRADYNVRAKARISELLELVEANLQMAFPQARISARYPVVDEEGKIKCLALDVDYGKNPVGIFSIKKPGIILLTARQGYGPVLGYVANPYIPPTIEHITKVAGRMLSRLVLTEEGDLVFEDSTGEEFYRLRRAATRLRRLSAQEYERRLAQLHSCTYFDASSVIAFYELDLFWLLGVLDLSDVYIPQNTPNPFDLSIFDLSAMAVEYMHTIHFGTRPSTPWQLLKIGHSGAERPADATKLAYKILLSSSTVQAVKNIGKYVDEATATDKDYWKAFKKWAQQEAGLVVRYRPERYKDLPEGSISFFTKELPFGWTLESGAGFDAWLYFGLDIKKKEKIILYSDLISIPFSSDDKMIRRNIFTFDKEVVSLINYSMKKCPLLSIPGRIVIFEGEETRLPVYTFTANAGPVHWEIVDFPVPYRIEDNMLIVKGTAYTGKDLIGWVKVSDSTCSFKYPVKISVLPSLDFEY